MALYEGGATYGTRSIGSLDGSGKTKMHGKVTEDRNENIGRFTFQFYVVDTPGNTFAATCDAIEEDFRTYRQAFLYKFGSANNPFVSWDPAVNSGFNARPSIRKVGGDGDTRGSRLYEVTIEVDLPAKLISTYGGRRSDSRVEIDTDAARIRTLTLSGTYTANTTSPGYASAYTQYKNTIAAYAATVYGALGGTWELINEAPVSRDETNKLCGFSRTYQELVYPQSSGGLDDASLVGARLILTRSNTNRVGYAYPKGTTVASLVTYTCSYSARLNLETVYGTSGNPAAIVPASDPTTVQDIYDSKVRPWLLSNLKALTGQFALVGEDVHLDPSTGAIEATLTIMATDGTTVFEASMRVSDTDNYGLALPGHWTGNQYAKSVHPGIAHRTRMVVFTAKGLAGKDGTPATNLEPGLLPPPPKAPPGGGNLTAILLQRQRDLDGPERLGPIGDDCLFLVTQTTTDTIEFYKDAAQSQLAADIKAGLESIAGSGSGGSGTNSAQKLTTT